VYCTMTSLIGSVRLPLQSSLLVGEYLQWVTNSSLTMNSLYLITLAIAEFSDSYPATSIARLLEHSRFVSHEGVIDKRSRIESKVYERT